MNKITTTWISDEIVILMNQRAQVAEQFNQVQNTLFADYKKAAADINNAYATGEIDVSAQRKQMMKLNRDHKKNLACNPEYVRLDRECDALSSQISSIRHEALKEWSNDNQFNEKGYRGVRSEFDEKKMVFVFTTLI